MSDVQDRISGSTRRIDGLLDAMARREAERRRAEDAERDRANADRARADSEKCRQAQVFYSDAYEAFGTLTPQPVDGEKPGRYRQRLYEGLRRKLPSDHDLFDVRADDLPASAARNFEQMMLAAALREGLKPSEANLPRDGSLVRRERTDAMSGAKSIEWMGRESFLKSMGHPPQRVLRIMNPKNGQVLMGEPLPKAW